MDLLSIIRANGVLEGIVGLLVAILLFMERDDK
jgi:hypothetical protein